MDPRLGRTETHFICVICIEWFKNEDAYKDSKGDRWDCCVPCGEREKI